MTCEICAHNNGTNCCALTQKMSGECPFAKTREQLDEGRRKANERISTLPQEKQLEIYDRYYRK